MSAACLRSPALRQARAHRERGEIGPEALAATEDEEIVKLVRRQEEIGLESVTDGEYRRASWQTDFLLGLNGVEAYAGERKFKFKGPQPQPILLRLKGRLGGFSDHPMLAHFRFLAAHTHATPKMTIPSPSTLHFRYGREAVPEAIYPDMDDFYRDLGETYRKTVAALADAGCRYLQLDEVNLAYLCDPALREQVRTRGDDPAALPFVYAGMINDAVAGATPDMTVTMHLCRGNFRSSFVASGGRSPKCCSTPSRCTAISWNMTASVPVHSSRCVLSPKARPWCSASSPPRPGSSNPATRSCAASRRRQSFWTSISSACRRNAALPRPRKAMRLPRTRSGPSSR
jgi:5-methyltetrahydropteroyltriglutamate--homocysteine methyltransferase